MQAKKHCLRPGQILSIGFLMVAIIGALLLMLPISTTEGNAIDFVDALFTSTSAVCVTGLIVVNTGEAFTLFGQIVILLLIQIGGLGFMTMASLFFMAIGKRFSLKERLVIQESFNSDTLQGLIRLVRNAVVIALSVETVGAIVLSFAFVPDFGWGKGIFSGIFISVSAFCNAGFDPLGMTNSLEAYISDPLVNIPIMLLIVTGGLGFAVLMDILHLRHRQHKLMLHTRLVLRITACLIVIGALLIMVTEWSNPKTLDRDGMGVPEKVMASFFQSITSRTAGFDTIYQGGLTPAGKFVTTMLMFVGASPAGTGGGIKTTTFFMVLLAVWSIVHNRRDYNVGRRRLGEQIARRAYAIFALALGLVVVGTLLVSISETTGGDFLELDDVLYEVVSAFSTTGLSCGITASLNDFSKLFLIFTMLVGRVGPLTVSMALSGDATTKNAIHYPEDRLMVG